MSIYTKTGDTGTTSLYGGKRVLKSDLQVEAYGSLDEFSSWLGVIIATLSDQKDIQLLTSIQNDLHKVMSVVSGNTKLNLDILAIYTKEHERFIDKLDEQLPKLTSFIIPQGGETASRIHVARTVCRRAERNLVRLISEKKVNDYDILLRYVNRLSDLLFMLARKYAKSDLKIS